MLMLVLVNSQIDFGGQQKKGRKPRRGTLATAAVYIYDWNKAVQCTIR